MSQVVDYSWARPNPAAIAAAGYIGAVRYLATDDPANAGKILRQPELAALHAAGLAVAVVWETTANRAGEGYAPGAGDAQAADRMADTLGWPADRPIYYAVDFQASPGQVDAYFQGVASAARRPWGVYGHYGIIEAYAGRTRYLWQCAAWSGQGAGTGGSIDGRRLSAHAVLYQRVGYVLGDTCDANDVLAPDWGGWHPNLTPTVEDDMPYSEDDLVRIVGRAIDEARVARQPAQVTLDGDPGRVLVTDGVTTTIQTDASLGQTARNLGLVQDQRAKVLPATYALEVLQQFGRTGSGTVNAAEVADAVLADLGPDLARQVADELARRLA